MTHPSRRERPFVIGVTGNIACGKSLVLGLLHDLGAETIDADRLYHGLIAPGTPLWRALRLRFGERIIAPSGEIDRRALGSIVFSDPAALADLDRITHPAVIAAVDDLIAASEADVVAVDAVKLVQSGMADRCDRVWLVECEPDYQLTRLMARNGLDEAEARRRIGSQPELAPVRERSDLIIDNSGDVAETRRQVERAWRELPILQS
ncbi:MAG: dephospho-CoA kinase [Thermomicrobiales bacterium]|nr:dephospho-CoA kinase [Thermomicrobiales bacterium]